MTSKTLKQANEPKARPAEIVREYGFPGINDIAGVTHVKSCAVWRLGQTPVKP